MHLSGHVMLTCNVRYHDIANGTGDAVWIHFDLSEIPARRKARLIKLAESFGIERTPETGPEYPYEVETKIEVVSARDKVGYVEWMRTAERLAEAIIAIDNESQLKR